MFVNKTRIRAAAAAAFALFSGVALADNAVYDDRMADLLDEDHGAIAAVPALDLPDIAAHADAIAEAMKNDVPEVRYDRDFLAELPKAEGGEQWQCLTEALYFEARGESVPGMFAVAEVILNRVDSPRYPDTICGVVNQGTGRKYACQFTYTCDGIPEVVNEPRSWDRVGKVARLLIDGAPRKLAKGATHYHTRAVNPNWAQVYPKVAAIGAHLFYRQPSRSTSS